MNFKWRGRGLPAVPELGTTPVKAAVAKDGGCDCCFVDRLTRRNIFSVVLSSRTHFVSDLSDDSIIPCVQNRAIRSFNLTEAVIYPHVVFAHGVCVSWTFILHKLRKSPFRSQHFKIYPKIISCNNINSYNYKKRFTRAHFISELRRFKTSANIIFLP